MADPEEDLGQSTDSVPAGGHVAVEPRWEVGPAAVDDRVPTAAGRAAAALILALGLILLIGAYLRTQPALVDGRLELPGVNWDSYTHLHPDERFITMVENSIALPKSVGEYFDTARSPLNPYNRGYNSFVYGTFPLFLVKWLGELLKMPGYDQIHLVGRVASTIFDLGSILLVFLIGRRLFDRRTGLLASLLTAGTVIQIQQSHFFTFDTFVGFFLLASFFLAVRLWQENRWYDYPLLGVAFGLAMASKINSAVFILVIGLLGLKRLRDVAIARERDRMSEWMEVAGWFAFLGLTAIVVFRVVEPYAFTGPGFFDVGISKRFLDDMGFVQKLVSGEVDQPPSVQWAGTTPYLFPLRNLVIWGMGLPLGLVGWAGLLLAGYRLLVCGQSRYLLIAAWVAFFFFYQGGQFSKTMRYFLPIVPLLAILGSHLMLELYRAVRSGLAVGGGLTASWWLRIGRWAAAGVIVLVAAGTLLYAFAFTRLYTEPVTRVAATEWIFANIPQGAAIANEHWDDPLPLRWQGRDAGWYRGTMLELYNDDNQEKLDKLIAQLDSTEYIFLSSNRLYGSIPRIPERYPMTTEYYRLLFSGQLGFDVVKSFTSYPDLFGIKINDDSAEEIFSVYDHPKVLIFGKSQQYSSATVRQLLGAVPLDGVLPLKSAQASHDGLLLSSEDRAIDEQGGTWSQIYDRQGLASQFPTLAWWLALELMGLLALPLAWRLFSGFPDRGYGLAKVLGLLVTAYLAWLLPSLRLLPFGRTSVLVGFAALALIAFVALRSRWTEFASHLLSHRNLFLVYEVVFLAAFALFWSIRVRNPDLWHLNFGGEKPMEFAYLNAVAKSTYFPPYDPWMAGGYMNYYYFGYVMVAAVMRLTGIVPAVAFNLAIPSIFALTAVGLFSFGFNFTSLVQRGVGTLIPRRALMAGIASVAFVLLVGNLDGPIQILESLWKLGGSQFVSTIPLLEGTVKAASGLWAVVAGDKALPVFDFWRSTRIVGAAESPTPIMEFPYFTFLYGDLHPHMMSMPLATLALGLVMSVVWRGTKGSESGQSRAFGVPGRWLTVAVAGMVVGAIEATNSWDYPTYLLLLASGFVLATVVRDRTLTLSGVVEATVSTAAVYLVARVLFLPFSRAYELFYNGVDPASAKTSIQHYLEMYGLFLFCAGSLLLVSLSRSRWHSFWLRALWGRRSGSTRGARRSELATLLVRPSPWMELAPYAALLLVGAAAAAALMGMFLVSLLILLGLVALLCILDVEPSPDRLLLALMVGVGAALTLGVEFITIKGDIGRMNTVFKFYLQAWFLFGTVSSVAIVGLLASGQRGIGSAWARGAWAAGLLVLVAGALVYPIAATPVKIGLRFQSMPPTLDGMAYMQTAAFKDQNRDIVLGRDWAAIRWLQDRVAGSPVVLEAQVPEYRWGSRVSIYTGLPTVMGWNWHQRQQRAGYQWMLDARLKDVKTMYDSTDTNQVSALLARYHVKLIYVGDLERAYYSPAGLAKFDSMVGSGLSVAYRADGVTIYEVRPAGTPSVILVSGQAGAG